MARHLVAAGAEVPAFVGTSSETIAAAASELAQHAHIEVEGYTSLDELLERHPVDAVAILTPAETHAEQLRLALDRGLSVLCEKPFVWGSDNDLATTIALVESFAAKGLVLRENCQWPYTLPAFDALHPGARSSPAVRRFGMSLAPSVTGAATIADSLPHAVSLLQALTPATVAELRDIRFSTRDSEATELTVRFTWPGDDGPVEASIQLTFAAEQPRIAGYSIDGHQARRLIRASDYAQFFADGPRLVNVPDPLAGLVSEFVSELSRPVDDPCRGRRYDMIERMRALTGLAQAYRNDPP